MEFSLNNPAETLAAPFARIRGGLKKSASPGKPQQTPIDGGLALLAAVGGAYAIKKLRDRKSE